MLSSGSDSSTDLSSLGSSGSSVTLPGTGDGNTKLFDTKGVWPDALTVLFVIEGSGTSEAGSVVEVLKLCV